LKNELRGNRVKVFNGTFQQYFSFIGGGNQSTR
jgi:hypothetical protein